MSRFGLSRNGLSRFGLSRICLSRICPGTDKSREDDISSLFYFLFRDFIAFGEACFQHSTDTLFTQVAKRHFYRNYSS